MNQLSLRFGAATLAAFAATSPIVASAAQAQVSTAERDVVPMLVWMVAGVAAAALILGTLYLFKRRIGAFPQNPTWKAPIAIMRASDLPGDHDPHEATAPGDPHAPAH
jgi:hypothetical protein